jgi:hypothetical protein
MTHIDPEERFLNDWPDGTKKSFGTAFTAHWDSDPSIFLLDRFFRPHNMAEGGKSRSEVASASREKQEASGVNVGTVIGLSKESDCRKLVDPRKFHVHGACA